MIYSHFDNYAYKLAWIKWCVHLKVKTYYISGIFGGASGQMPSGLALPLVWIYLKPSWYLIQRERERERILLREKKIYILSRYYFV